VITQELLGPKTYTSLVVHTLTAFGNELSVRLHVSLLEVIGELVEVLVVGEKKLSLGTVEIVVPDADDSQDNGKVLLQRSLLEVLVHAVSTLEELLEVIIADDESDRQSDGTPEGVTPTNPIPELEHVLLSDAEGSDSLGVRTEGDEVLSDVGLVFGGLEEPVSGTLSVGDCLLSSEGLAGDDEEGGLGVANPQSLGEVGSVDIGDEVGGEVPLGVGLERLSNHDGTQVGTTDTNVNDGVDGLPRVSLPSSVPNRLGELLDVLKHGGDLSGALLADLELVEVTESDVEDGTILRGVDVLPGEHLVPVGLDFGLANEVEEGVQDGLGNQVLGVIQEEGDCRIVWRDVFLAEFFEPVCILREEVLENES
jgi:hypothetical protein